MFIYVMDEESKAKLEQLGYTLISEDKENKVYCFQNKYGRDISFALDVPHVVSDIVLF